MGRVVHFEIHATEPERVIAFYEQLFGWKFTSWPGPWDYWMIETGAAEQPGINGGLLRRHGAAPIEGAAVNAYVVSVGVTSAAESANRAAQLGGTVVVPVKAIPGVGWLGYVKDPDGNILGIMQNDPGAQ
jgi:uncharacterized protein